MKKILLSISLFFTIVFHCMGQSAPTVEVEPTVVSTIMENDSLSLEQLWSLFRKQYSDRVALISARDRSYLTVLLNGETHTIFFKDDKQVGFNSTVPMTEKIFSRYYSELYYDKNLRDAENTWALNPTVYFFFYFEDGDTIQFVVKEDSPFFSICHQKL